MRSGALTHRVTITAPAGVLDETLPVNVDTSVPMNITADPLQFQSRENLNIGGLQTKTIYTLECRYRTDMKPTFVLVEQCCTQRTFQIVSDIVPSDRKDAVKMTCVTSG